MSAPERGLVGEMCLCLLTKVTRGVSSVGVTLATEQGPCYIVWRKLRPARGISDGVDPSPLSHGPVMPVRVPAAPLAPEQPVPSWTLGGLRQNAWL